MTDVCIVMLGLMMEYVNFRNVANKDDVHNQHWSYSAFMIIHWLFVYATKYNTQ